MASAPGTGPFCAWGSDGDACGGLVASGKIGMETLLDLLSYYFTADVAMMMATGLLSAMKVCARVRPCVRPRCYILLLLLIDEADACCVRERVFVICLCA